MATVPFKPASALTINRNFVGGLAPVTVAGGGNIIDIFNTAADWWEASILDPHVLNIDFSWADLAGSTLGTATTSDPIRVTDGTIRFDNTGTSWFLDATPSDNSEYLTFTETSADLGGGVVNTSREYSDAIGDAFGRFDLLTVAAHEIGHFLGILDHFGNPLPDPLLITGPRPHAGTLIGTVTTGGGHIDNGLFPRTLMNPFISPSVRRTQSAIDILAAAERSNFVNVNLDPLAVPEPAPIAIVVLGLIATMTMHRRKSRIA